MPTFTRRQLEAAKIRGAELYSIIRNTLLQDENLSISIHQKPGVAVEKLRYMSLLCNQCADQYAICAQARKEGVIENTPTQLRSENAKLK